MRVLSVVLFGEAGAKLWPASLLAAHEDSAPKAEQAFDVLKTCEHETVQLPAAVHRPWSSCASLKEENGCKVERIAVKPGESLLLRCQHRCTDHGVVVTGTAVVQVGDVEYETLPGQFRYIPPKRGIF